MRVGHLARPQDDVSDQRSQADAILSGKPRQELDAREAPLAEVEKWWSSPLASGERLVFIP